jgi:DNA-binding GntR family transcriptional regulator
MIVQDILNGELQPKSKLVVAELKQKYNVGASPIREALVQLSWCKYVNLQPQKGCWVAPIRNEDFNDLYESIRFVSSALLNQAMENQNEGWELEVLTAFHKLSRMQYSQDELNWHEWETRLSQFHTSLVTGARSHHMFAFFNDLLTQITRYRHYAIVNGLEHTATSVNACEQIMKSILAKDTASAIKKLDDYLEWNRQQIQVVLDNLAEAA